ncbi:probable actin-histidine N-methyltransferase [Coccomyxa sp. Obi]|nr:probable actin-histidine N-methyltransferase [Coccomyxa sp. Obi]
MSAYSANHAYTTFRSSTTFKCPRRPFPAAPLQRRHQRVSSALAVSETARSEQLIQWLQDHGAPQQGVSITEVVQEGNTLDVSVAARDLQAGELALRIPDHLVITLDRVFEDDTLAELLTTDKLSELACLTLYLMYEKKNGRQSVWYEFIKELDRIQARGQMGAKSPLLWDEGQVDEYLAGSPLVAEIKERLKGIEKEYAELDTVWFMAGSLFNGYPYDIPTEAFSMNLFRQAFAAVQASVVHLQGVPLSKRFALVPLGPPLLSYSSTAKAMLTYNREAKEVQLAVDRSYKKGEPIKAWCGPQPNRRLLLNYGIVTDDNPHDKMALTVTLPHADPLFQAKRTVLQQHNLSTQQTFQLQRDKGLPEQLLPYLRLAHCTDADSLRKATLETCCSAPISPENERTVLHQLASHLQERLDRYRTSCEEDEAIISSSTAGPRQKVAARLLRIEKAILRGALEEALRLADDRDEAVRGDARTVHVRLSS